MKFIPRSYVAFNQADSNQTWVAFSTIAETVTCGTVLWRIYSMMSRWYVTTSWDKRERFKCEAKAWKRQWSRQDMERERSELQEWWALSRLFVSRTVRYHGLQKVPTHLEAKKKCCMGWWTKDYCDRTTGWRWTSMSCFVCRTSLLIGAHNWGERCLLGSLWKFENLRN